MTLKEFIEKNPSAVEEAAKCKNLQEFKSLTEKAGITFDTSKKLEKAFELVKNQNVTTTRRLSATRPDQSAVWRSCW